jgi:hypothetical protein
MAKIDADVNDFLEFIEGFIAEEYQNWVSAYTERNSSIFEKSVKDFKSKYYDGDFYIDIKRKNSVDKIWFDNAIGFLRGTQKRIIFQVKKYLLVKSKPLYSAYLSSADSGGDTYFLLVFCTKTENSFKIVSSYLTDHEGYFDYHDGVEFDELPEPIKVIKLQPPTDPADLEEYNSE